MGTRLLRRTRTSSGKEYYSESCRSIFPCSPSSPRASFKLKRREMKLGFGEEAAKNGTDAIDFVPLSESPTVESEDSGEENARPVKARSLYRFHSYSQGNKSTLQEQRKDEPDDMQSSLSNTSSESRRHPSTRSKRYNSSQSFSEGRLQRMHRRHTDSLSPNGSSEHSLSVYLPTPPNRPTRNVVTKNSPRSMGLHFSRSGSVATSISDTSSSQSSKGDDFGTSSTNGDAAVSSRGHENAGDVHNQRSSDGTWGGGMLSSERKLEGLILGNELARGSSGIVFKGLLGSTGRQVAVKRLSSIGASDVAAQRAEIELMRTLRHKNIVQYEGTIENGSSLDIVMEYVSGGSLSQAVKQFGKLPPALVAKFTFHLVQGLNYLHSNQIIHRDIKGGNVLLTVHGVAKLADFGTSRNLKRLTLNDETLTNMRGSVPWMAPEVVKQTGHGLPADVWSLGATVLEMSSGKRPWSDKGDQFSALFTIATTTTPPPIPEDTSAAIRGFLEDTLQVEPRNRWSAAELVKHPLVIDLRR